MNYTVREYEPELHIVAENGLVSASVIEWTASRARRIIGRDLVAGERFYWLSKICNKSDKKGEGTQLLRFVINTLQERNATIGLIADPGIQKGTDSTMHRIALQNRLIHWYMRHGFQKTASHHNVLVRPSDTIYHSHGVGALGNTIL